MSPHIDLANERMVWVKPVTQAPVDTTLSETLKLTQQNGILIFDVSVTCVLEGVGVVFKNTRTNTCTGNTNVLGRLSLEIISLTGADTQFNINAWLTDSPSVQVPPLSVRFISKVNTVSLQPRHAISFPDKPVVLTASVMDKNGGALQGVAVTFNASEGARLTPASAITDDNGQASTQVTRDTPSLVIVTATAGGISDHTSVGFYYKVALTAKEAYATPGSPVELTATVTNKNGGGLQGIAVSFSASDGATLTLASATTDKNGQASTWVTSDNAGLVTVTATAQGAKGSADLILKKLGRYSIKEISIDAFSHEKFFILLLDPDGNKLSNQKVYLALITYKEGDIELVEYDPHTYSNGEFSVILKGTPGAICRLQVVVGDFIVYIDINFGTTV